MDRNNIPEKSRVKRGQHRTVTGRALSSSAALLGLIFIVTPVIGADATYSQIPDIVVKKEIVTDIPASVTTIEYSEEYMRNIRGYEELLKPLAGVSANNFDQGGPGYGFTMRGFSDRKSGSEAAIYFDGVSLNYPSHNLSNGYGDAGFIIPELIGSLELTRGPFDVRAGANALGGSIRFTTVDEPTTSATVTAGSYDYLRGLGIANYDVGGVSGYVAVMASDGHGYRDNTDFDQKSLFNKVKFSMPGGKGSILFIAYDAEYGSPGYISLPMIKSGAIDEQDARNPDDGGDKESQMLILNYKQNRTEWFSLNAYALHNENNRYSSFGMGAVVPFPAGTAGIQRLQYEDRVVVGVSAEKYFIRDLTQNSNIDLLLGVGIKKDFSDQEQWDTTNRVIVTPDAPDEDFDVEIVNKYMYLTSDYRPTEWLKLTAGARWDHLDYEIDGKTGQNFAPVDNVTATDPIFSPKAGVLIRPFSGRRFDIFANYGEGFRPVNAQSDDLPLNPSLEHATLETKEVGIQYQSPDDVWYLRTSYYDTEHSNETLGTGQGNPPIKVGPSERTGWDTEVRANLMLSNRIPVSLYASYTTQDGELTEAASGANHIVEVADYFFKYGFDTILPVGSSSSKYATLSVGVLHSGEKCLNTTCTLETEKYMRVDASLTYNDEKWKGPTGKGIQASLRLVAYGNGDDNLQETAFAFAGASVTGVSAKSPLTVTGSVSIPF